MSLFRTENRDAAGWDALRSFAMGGPGSLLNGSMKSALRLVPAYSATSLIADQLSVLPFSVYDVVNGRRTKLDQQPELCRNPNINPVHTRIEWLHQFSTSYLLRGNSFGLITAVDQRGTATKVAWLPPDNVNVDESTPTPGYYFNGKLLDINTVVHIPCYPLPGSVVGLSPIGQFKAQLETGLAANDFAGNWFKHGATPSGHLKYMGKIGGGTLTDEQSASVKERFRAAVSGNDFFVSGSDWDWKALSVSANEAQFLQTIKATANQIASIYHVDPADIGGESGSSMTYSTLELNQIKFQVQALLPMFARLEAHLNRLLPGTQYVKFNADATVRTELKTRMESHEIALRTGMETHPEGRALEDRPPMTDAEWDQWLAYRAAGTGAGADPGSEQARRIAEIIQKIYLGVGVVITEDEAREIIRMTGMDLPANVTIKPPAVPAITQEGV